MKRFNFFQFKTSLKKPVIQYDIMKYLPKDNSNEGCEFIDQKPNMDENPFIATELGSY